MNIVKNLNYELSYDDDTIILYDKKNKKLSIKVFTDELNDIEIDAPKSNLTLDVDKFTLNSNTTITLYSKLDKNIPSIFFN